jgi:CheY-like chemotaxis protein
MPGSILLVDDRPEPLAPLAEVLKSLGWAVTVCASPIHALGLLQTNQFRVVVSDYQMPEMSGLNFLLKAMPLLPDADFILMSGMPDPGVQDACRARGISFLQKPFAPSSLLEQINSR